MGEWTIGAVLDAIAEVIPGRLMTVCGERRSTFAELADRTRRLANYLSGQGFGAHRERDELENWECGQDRVALIMHNDLYPDMVIGCLKARTVPVNVNYNYAPREVAELLEYLRPRAVIYHRSFGPKLADVLPAATADLMISVDDDGSAAQLPGAVNLEDVLAQGDTDARHHPVARRRDDGVHRRHHRTSQRRHVAPERHLCRVDERCRPRNSRRNTCPGAARWSAMVRRVTTHACGRHVDGLRGSSQRASRSSTTTGRSSTHAPCSRPRSGRRSA